MGFPLFCASSRINTHKILFRIYINLWYTDIAITGEVLI